MENIDWQPSSPQFRSCLLFNFPNAMKSRVGEEEFLSVVEILIAYHMHQFPYNSGTFQINSEWKVKTKRRQLW